MYLCMPVQDAYNPDHAYVTLPTCISDMTTVALLLALAGSCAKCQMLCYNVKFS